MKPAIFLPPVIAKAKSIEALGKELIAHGFKKSLFYVDDELGGKRPVNLDAGQLAFLVMTILMPPPQGKPIISVRRIPKGEAHAG